MNGSGAMKAAEAAEGHQPQPLSSSSFHLYSKIPGRTGVLPADTAALVAVAAAYVNVSPQHMLHTLSTLELHLVRVEKAYAGRRTDLHAAVGGALFAINDLPGHTLAASEGV